MAGAVVCQFLLLLFHKSLTSHVVFRQCARRSGRPRAPVEAGSVGALTRAHSHERPESQELFTLLTGRPGFTACAKRERTTGPPSSLAQPWVVGAGA